MKLLFMASLILPLNPESEEILNSQKASYRVGILVDSYSQTMIFACTVCPHQKNRVH